MEKDSSPSGVRTINGPREEQTLRSSAAPDAPKDLVLATANETSTLPHCKD